MANSQAALPGELQHGGVDLTGQVVERAINGVALDLYPSWLSPS